MSPNVTWKPDPGAAAIDALTLEWSRYKTIYCFPPGLIGKVLQFIQESRTTAILVYPYWPTQVSYPQLQQLMRSPPLSIKMHRKTIVLPHQPEQVDPLYPKLQLHGCVLSGHP